MNTSGRKIRNIEEFEIETNALIDYLSIQVDLNVKGVFSTFNDVTVCQTFNGGDCLQEVRSLSKFVLGMCIGVLHEIDSSSFPIEMEIWPYIKMHYNGKVLPAPSTELKQAKVWHLLTQTIGFEKKELLFSHTVKDINPELYLDYLLKEPIIYENGEKFCYSNASAYLLSVVFQQFLGMNLYDFAIDKLFNPLKIDSHEWGNYGSYCCGATGLKLHCKDIHKLGILVLKNGVWNNRRIIHSEYLKDMTSAKVKIEDPTFVNKPLSPTHYGYFTFIDKEKNYFANGARGKYIVVLPEKSLVLTVIADTSATTLLQNIIKNYIDRF